MHETVLIADVYQRLQEAKRKHYEVDITREAEGLSMLVRPLGRRQRRVAIVPEDHYEAINAYQRAGFSIRSMNGNRPTELIAFISEEARSLHADPPDHLVVVSTDQAFDILCATAVNKKTKVSIWAPGTDVPPQLMHPEYDYRQLEDLLPGTRIKVASVAVYLDYENLHIGLEKRGIHFDPKALIDAVRAETADLGSIVEIVAYADWYELSKHSNREIQRELALLGVRTQYQISVHGKNSSDMAMANDIRTVVDRDGSAPDAIDTVVVGTRDADFTTIVETAKSRHKKVVILALQEGLSRKLAQTTEVRYLDRYLQTQNSKSHSTTDEQFTLLVGIVNYLYCHRYNWAYIDRLVEALEMGPDGVKKLRKMVESGILKPGKPDNSRALALDLNHPDSFLVWWIYDRLNFCLNKKKMPYVDTAFLARGMEMDKTLRQFDIGQTHVEAKKILERVAATGHILKRRQKHPQKPQKVITTWHLVAQSNDQNPKTATVDLQVDSPCVEDNLERPKDVLTANAPLTQEESEKKTEANEKIVQETKPLPNLDPKKVTVDSQVDSPSIEDDREQPKDVLATNASLAQEESKKKTEENEKIVQEIKPLPTGF